MNGRAFTIQSLVFITFLAVGMTAGLVSALMGKLEPSVSPATTELTAPPAAQESISETAAVLG